MRHFKWLIASMVAVVCSSTAALPQAAIISEPAEIGLSESGLKNLNGRVEKFVREDIIPGAVVLVARNGSIGHLKSFGVLDPATVAPMPEDAIFRIFSMSKAISAALALTFVEQGELSLATEVSRFLPAFVELTVADLGEYDLETDAPRVHAAKNRVRILDLLRMSGGFADYNFYPNYPGMQYRNEGIGNQTLTIAEVADLAAEIPLLAEPGTVFSYSETNYDVLGRVLEIIEGRSFSQIVQDRIFGPLGMAGASPPVAGHPFYLQVLVDGLLVEIKADNQWSVRHQQSPVANHLHSAFRDLAFSWTD